MNRWRSRRYPALRRPVHKSARPPTAARRPAGSTPTLDSRKCPEGDERRGRAGRSLRSGISAKKESENRRERKCRPPSCPVSPRLGRAPLYLAPLPVSIDYSLPAVAPSRARCAFIRGTANRYRLVVVPERRAVTSASSRFRAHPLTPGRSEWPGLARVKSSPRGLTGIPGERQ